MLMTFEGFEALAAVSLRSALKYRRNWNKNGPTVKLLRKMMPTGSTGYRLYFPIGGPKRTHVVAPLPVRLALRKAGYKITDYLAKKCVKANDKEQKNVFNIGKVISKDAIAKAAFDNDPQLQNSSTSEFTMVVSCHPYDIIGMSTGRDWDNMSCMRLKDFRHDHSDGMNKHYVERDVAEGTLVAYAIRTNDKNITKPLGRCLLKPFKLEGGEDLKYRRETRIYGNPVPGFDVALSAFLRKLNAGIPKGTYRLNAELYNDGVGGTDVHSGNQETNEFDWIMLDQQATLREKPYALVSFANYMLQKCRDGINEPYIMIKTVINAANDAKVPARYCKQAARVLATEPGYLHQYAEEMMENPGYISEYIGNFMGNKEFRVNLQAFADKFYDEKKKHGELDDDYNFWAAGLISPKAARNDIEGHFKFGNSLYTLAVDYVAGVHSVPRDLLLSNPQLHKLVYLYAEICRDTLVFKDSELAASAQIVLAQIPPVDTELDAAEYSEFVETIKEVDRDGRDFLVVAYALRMKDRQRAVGLISELSNRLIRPAILDRKVRRRLQKDLPELNDNIKRQLVRLVMEYEYLIADDQRSLDDAFRGGMELDNYSSWQAVMSMAPAKIFPWIWFTNGFDAEQVAQGMADEMSIMKMIFQIPKVKALNDAQQKIFDLAGVYADIQMNMPNPFTIVDKEAAVEAFSEVEFQSESINLSKYPQFLNAENAANMNVWDFVGTDLGNKSLQMFEKKISLRETIRSIRLIYSESGETGKLLTAFGVSDSEVEMAPTNWMKALPPARARELIEFANAYVKRAQDFIDTFPNPPKDSPQYLDEWAEYFSGYPREEVIEHLRYIGIMVTELTSAGGGAMEEIEATGKITVRMCTKAINESMS